MAKTELTKKVEKAVLNHFKKIGNSICIEVKVGVFSTDNIITEKTEIIDAVVYESDSTIRCIEIKTSESDLRSSASLSFFGDYNYLILPVELYDKVKEKEWFKDKFSWTSIGIMTCSEGGYLHTARKAKKRRVGIGLRSVLVESMLRSSARDANRWYVQKYGG